ncbi:malate synthase [Shewanella youngdeokensis]|uniref:Malate synthase n=1 Tax=Shewanella youngdeokensis TaxID=2999068 RepID=A0ABZ0JVX5_9GAMM|nr:malate synthase [Shewanella sp. DAU334]
MEISTLNTATNNHENNHFVGSQPVDVNVTDAIDLDSTATTAKLFLDMKFPLATGSHQDACSYVVYYQQLLIFMKDGTQTGLRYPKQFVALNGHKSEPTAILLNDNGVHVELNFGRQGKNGASDCANIEDILVEGHQYWISLINVENTAMATSMLDHAFTAKDGSDYDLKR